MQFHEVRRIEDYIYFNNKSVQSHFSRQWVELNLVLLISLEINIAKNYVYNFFIVPFLLLELVVTQLTVYCVSKQIKNNPHRFYTTHICFHFFTKSSYQRKPVIKSLLFFCATRPNTFAFFFVEMLVRKHLIWKFFY